MLKSVNGKFLTLFLALICLSSTTLGFVARPSVTMPSTTAASTSYTTTSLNVFGNKKSQAQKEVAKAEEPKYWQGEWVCKDCGYIYNRVR
jgi:hypothetical protein